MFANRDQNSVRVSALAIQGRTPYIGADSGRTGQSFPRNSIGTVNKTTNKLRRPIQAAKGLTSKQSSFLASQFAKATLFKPY